MRSAHITRHHAEALSGGMDADVSAVQAAAVTVWDHLGWEGEEEREIDALMASVDRELAAEAEAAIFRVTRSFTDPQRAQRAQRRAGRTVLRSLPVRLDVADAHESEAA
jgi:hypothetical protein